MKFSKIILIVLLVSGCSGYNKIAKDSEQMVMSTLWFQKSAEMRAIYYQAFNIAELRVKQILENNNDGKSLAVVVDIDETMLDNSPSEGKNILEGERYSKERWLDWTDKAIAEALPGSLDFAEFLDSAGVELFYISNRTTRELKSTLVNLEKAGFPNIREDHVLLKSDTSSKKSRRELVAEDHEIILLIGDNLGDFSELFDNRSDQLGDALVDQHREDFGKKFIVLPNPMYGTWTSALLGSTKGMSPAQIARLRKKFLVDY